MNFKFVTKKFSLQIFIRLYVIATNGEQIHLQRKKREYLIKIGNLKFHINLIFQ